MKNLNLDDFDDINWSEFEKELSEINECLQEIKKDKRLMKKIEKIVKPHDYKFQFNKISKGRYQEEVMNKTDSSYSISSYS